MDWLLSVAGEAIAAILAAAAIAIFAWLSGALRDLRRKIDELESASDIHDDEIRAEARRAVRSLETQLEAKVERHESEIAALKAAQITHDDLALIYRRLEPVTAQMGEVKGSIDALSTQLGIITQHLLEKRV